MRNPYFYTARRFDTESGLYYYRARMYNPHIGRFMQTDPIGYGDGINWYAYTRNNPVMFVDPMGLWDVELGFAKGIGAKIFIGYNNGRWSFGGMIGAGVGIAAKFDPDEIEYQEPGLHGFGQLEGSFEVGPAGVTLTPIGADTSQGRENAIFSKASFNFLKFIDFEIGAKPSGTYWEPPSTNVSLSQAASKMGKLKAMGFVGGGAKYVTKNASDEFNDMMKPFEAQHNQFMSQVHNEWVSRK